MIDRETIKQFPEEFRLSLEECFEQNGWLLESLAANMQVACRNRLATLNPGKDNFILEYTQIQTELRLWSTIEYNLKQFKSRS